jgi:hypothetical protein
MQQIDALSYRFPHIAALLGGIIAVSIFLYGAMLLLAVSHTAGRTQAQHQMQEIASTISTLEAKYLQATRLITPETAKSRGFVPPVSTDTVFAAATHDALTLSNVSGQQ